MNDYNIEA